MARKIQHKRGPEKDLPRLEIAEWALTTDTEKPFIGAASGNVEIAKKKDLEAVSSEVSKKADATEVTALGSQLADNANLINSKFLKMLKDGEVTKIKLLGDSITAGVGASGYTVEATRLIMERAGSLYYETGKDWTLFKSWANLFRKYINTNYPSIDFFNAGIGGLSAKEVVESYLTEYIGDNLDVAFVQLGTNDRSVSTLAEYKADMEFLLDYVDQRSKLMIVMSPPPSMSDFADSSHTDYAEGINFGAREIDTTLTEICNERGYIFLSNYRYILDYAATTNTPLDKILQITGSHPLDKGHWLIWEHIQQRLGFISDINEWVDKSAPRVEVTSDTSRTTPYDIKDFPIGVSYTRITNAQATNLGMPVAYGGVLVTVKTTDTADGYVYQIYKTYRNTYGEFTRTYQSGYWGSWSKVVTDENGTIKYGDYALGDTITSTTPITSFDEKQTSYIPIRSSNADIANFPERKAGLLITMRAKSGYEAFGYQLYHVNYVTSPNLENMIYTRYWTGSAWSSWKRISGNLALTTNQRNAMTNGLSMGDMVYDRTLDKPVWRNAANNGWVDNLSKFVGVPASATSPGNPGDRSADDAYLYVCHAANTWKRVAVATW